MIRESYDKIIAILSLALAAASFAAPSYSADVNKDKKASQVVSKQETKAAKEAAKQTKEAAKKAKKDAKALAKQKKEQQKAAKKAEKLAKKKGKKTPEAHAVPEIDGSYAALAISLLAGAVAIRRERYRKA